MTALEEAEQYLSSRKAGPSPELRQQALQELARRELARREGQTPSQADSQMPPSTIGATPGLGARDFFPQTAQNIQQVSQHPIASNFSFPLGNAGRFAAGAIGDVGNIMNSVGGAGLSQARRMSEQRPLPSLPQALAQRLRGGEQRLGENQQPSRLDPAMQMMAEGIVATPALNAIGALPQMLRVGKQAGQIAAGAVENAQWKGFFGPSKTVDDILRTPEAKLPRLSNTQREVFFSERSRKIKDQTRVQTQQVKAEIEAMKRDLGNASTQRVLELRPQLPQAFSRKSSHWRSLIDKEMAPVANEVVPEHELAMFVKDRFSKDPEGLAEVSSRLGLGNEHVVAQKLSPLVDEFGRPIEQAIETGKTFGQLHKNVMDFRQQLPRAVREGVGIYGREEHYIDDTINTLVQFMKSRGVNLSNSDAFWSGWAPVRNQMVQEFRPYNMAGTKTMSGSRRLIQLEKSIDPDNQIYAKAASEALGIPDLPGGELKRVVSRLTTAQKQLLNNRIAQAEASGELAEMKNRVSLMVDKRQKVSHVMKWVVNGLAGGLATGAGFGIAKKAMGQ